jgi:hypothetical protein
MIVRTWLGRAVFTLVATAMMPIFCCAVVEQYTFYKKRVERHKDALQVRFCFELPSPRVVWFYEDVKYTEKTCFLLQ